jgi:hypothetical protein
LISRRLAGLWGVASFTVLAVGLPAVLAWLEMPAPVVWGGAGLGALLLGLKVAAALRGAAASPDSSLFAGNALGEPVSQTYRPPPCHRELAPEAGERVLAAAAPILQVAAGAAGLLGGGSASLLGKGTTADAANAVVLTNRRLLFLVLGPDDIRRRGADSGAVRLLQQLPGDAAAKRRLLWQHGASAMPRALEALLAGRELAELAAGQPGFSLPLADLSSWRAEPARGLWELGCGGAALRYSFRVPGQLERLAAALREMGLPPQA